MVRRECGWWEKRAGSLSLNLSGMFGGGGDVGLVKG